jgi:hypothetical protein
VRRHRRPGHTLGNRAKEIDIGATVRPRPGGEIGAAHPAAGADAMAEHALLAEQHRAVRDGLLIARERVATLLGDGRCGDLCSELECEAADENGG